MTGGGGGAVISAPLCDIVTLGMPSPLAKDPDAEAKVLAASKDLGANWATEEDAREALKLTGRDAKLDYLAARKLLALGSQGLHDAVGAMAPIVKEWTLHWSQSRNSFFYARQGKATHLLKIADCPFGWARDAQTKKFCCLQDPSRHYDSLPANAHTVANGAGASGARKRPAADANDAREAAATQDRPAKKPSWGPGKSTSASSGGARADANEPPGIEYSRYIAQLDEHKRQKIEGKREYFFRGLGDASLRNQIQMDEEASYSVTEMNLAEQTSQMVLETLRWQSQQQNPPVCITDATACVGGNTVNFAKHFAHVYSVELDATRARFLRNNVELLCPEKNVDVLCQDYTDVRCYSALKQQVVFFDPPWGGESYSETRSVDLFLSGKNLVDICCQLQGHTQFIVLKVPFNFGFDSFLRQGRGVLILLKQEPIGRGRGGRPKFVLMILQVKS
eukprot:COSAG02_NODE_263_length_26627_cov_47.198168_14_plen_450_part_00